jgi:hypothetical protein
MVRENIIIRVKEESSRGTRDHLLIGFSQLMCLSLSLLLCLDFSFFLSILFHCYMLGFFFIDQPIRPDQGKFMML